MSKSDIIIVLCFLATIFGGSYLILGSIVKQDQCLQRQGAQFFDPYTWECKDLK